MPRILTICTANVCRSPAAAGVLAALEPFDVVVESAGVAADHGRAICPISRVWLTAAVGFDLGASHRSRPLDVDILGRQDLVLVASLRQRRLVAAMAPSVIPRLFTYTEAALLARHAARRRRLPQSGLVESGVVESGVVESGSLTGFVEDMAAQRGLVRLSHEGDELAAEVAASGWKRFLRPQPPVPSRSPYDVPDAHTTLGRDHEPTFDALGPALHVLRDELAAYLGPDRTWV